MSSLTITTRRTKSGPRYVVRYRLGGRAYPIEHGGAFKTLREAKARRDLIGGELAAGRNPRDLLRRLTEVPPPAHTLDERFAAFIESRVDVGEKTLALYRNARDKLGALAESNPSTLTPADFQAWIAANAKGPEKTDGVSPRTLHHYLSSIRQVLDFCDVEPNPARSKKVRLPADETAEVEAPRTTNGPRSRRRCRSGSRLSCG
jgi:hypothetical protein